MAMGGSAARKFLTRRCAENRGGPRRCILLRGKPALGHEGWILSDLGGSPHTSAQKFWCLRTSRSPTALAQASVLTAAPAAASSARKIGLVPATIAPACASEAWTGGAASPPGFCIRSRLAIEAKVQAWMVASRVTMTGKTPVGITALYWTAVGLRPA
jgi:hypothetical protein